jgi:hypothetical protein
LFLMQNFAKMRNKFLWAATSHFVLGEKFHQNLKSALGLWPVQWTFLEISGKTRQKRKGFGLDSPDLEDQLL